MAKLEKRERNLLILLGIVVSIGAIDFLLNTEDYLSYYTKDEIKNEQLESKSTTQNAQSKQASDRFVYTKWDRDPFHNSSIRVKKAVYRTVQEISFQLKAISFSEGMSVAMINNQVLKVGDLIEGYTVKSIQPKQVVIEKDGQSKTLKLQ